ncbi:hypothetical protein [Endozoicomonas sp. Mp262]|uniref:hypothetical protein n=1 Tax=Endozoicomonas sp. Mp262 TaxID=2919499 RepID=UPI0021D891A2
MDDLIRDDGEIRRCPKNMARLGYVKSWWHFFSYRQVVGGWVSDYLIEAAKVTAKAGIAVFFCLLTLLTLPALPFLQCFFSVRRAKAEVAAEAERQQAIRAEGGGNG